MIGSTVRVKNPYSMFYDQIGIIIKVHHSIDKFRLICEVKLDDNEKTRVFYDSGLEFIVKRNLSAFI